ncbi:hypothetical protein [Marivirga arenosa]|uniref:YD repeat-containing protein n=1 Tax=Marivirga arenosa TaxID=3059076 RepID=A0AA49JAM0_9BACT|nr:hypothetical protein [Marivirga sp. BKB1-2]WKK82949.2 hypothetical protein QYS47_13655 [Marivirga sp. BKB1-2]
MKYNLIILFIVIISCESKTQRVIKKLSNGNDTLIEEPSYLRKKVFQESYPGILVFKQIIKDDQGRIIQERTIDENGRLVKLLMQYPIIDYTYDSIGNLILTERRDRNHQLTSHMGEAPSVKNKYDKNNNLVKIKYLDENGNYFYPISQTSIVEHSYDDLNRRIQTKYLNKKRNPKRKASIIDYSYDSLNRVIKEYIYDYSNGNRELFYFKEFKYTPNDTIEKRIKPDGSLIMHLKRTKEAVYVITEETDSTTTFYISEEHK